MTTYQTNQELKKLKHKHNKTLDDIKQWYKLHGKSIGAMQDEMARISRRYWASHPISINMTESEFILKELISMCDERSKINT
jgi:hypothetical protein